MQLIFNMYESFVLIFAPIHRREWSNDVLRIYPNNQKEMESLGKFYAFLGYQVFMQRGYFYFEARRSR